MDTYTLITGATSGIGLDLAVRLSGERWFLADSSKFDKVYPAGISALDSAGIITDSVPNESYRDRTTIKEAEPV